MDKDSLTFRGYKDSDYNRLLELSIEFSNFFDPLDPWRKEEQNFATTAKYFLDKDLALIKNNGGKIIVAVIDSKVIGFVSLHFKKQDEEELLYRKPMTIGYVESLFISKDFRNKGVGDKLMNAAENYFRDNKCSYAKLEVFAPNVNARNFYLNHGYQDMKMEMIKTL